MRGIGLFPLLLIFGCAVPYSIEAPEQFKRYTTKTEFKWITADGVMLKAREVENYPEASLSFWSDAARQHLEKIGYLHEKTTCFKTKDGLDGCTLKFALPHGAEDWVYQETIFVVDDAIVLLEAGGEYSRFNAVETDLAKALKSFRPHQ